MLFDKFTPDQQARRSVIGIRRCEYCYVKRTYREGQDEIRPYAL